jgi:hypothetical protein
MESSSKQAHLGIISFGNGKKLAELKIELTELKNKLLDEIQDESEMLIHKMKEDKEEVLAKTQTLFEMVNTDIETKNDRLQKDLGEIRDDIASIARVLNNLCNMCYVTQGEVNYTRSLIQTPEEQWIVEKSRPHRVNITRNGHATRDGWLDHLPTTIDHLKSSRDY